MPGMTTQGRAADRSAPHPTVRGEDEAPGMVVTRVGLASFGIASRVFHEPLLRATPGLELVAVATSRPAEVRTQVGEGVRLLPDAAALIDDPDVEVVVVTTPNDSHVPLAEAALAAGKHVIVEKPLALDAQEATRLAKVASQARADGLVAAVSQNRRWDGDFLTVLDVLDRGTLGRLVSLESRFDRFRPQPQQRWRERPGPGGGLWIDLGAHLVDQALMVFGAPGWVSADLRTVRDGASADDDAHVVLGYDHLRLRVVLGATTVAAHPGPRFVLHGTEGTLSIEGLDPQESQLAAGMLPGEEGYGLGAPDGILTTAEGESVLPRLGGDYLDFYTRFRDAVLGLDDVPVTIEEGVAVMRVIDAARRSAESGRRVISPLADVDTEVAGS